MTIKNDEDLDARGGNQADATLRRTAADDAGNQIARAEGVWRPIETAPKDAGEILVCGCNGTSRVLSAQWITSFFEGDTAIEAGWYHNGTVKLAAPTRWMPLPSPPKAEGVA